MSVVLPNNYDLKLEYEKLLIRIEKKYSNESNENNEFKLPNNYKIVIDKGNKVLKYSKMENYIRKELQIKLPENYNLEEEYNKLKEKVIYKFFTENKEFTLPVYYRIQTKNNKNTLFYHNQNNKIRFQKLLPENYNLEEEYNKLKEKVEEKEKLLIL